MAAGAGIGVSAATGSVTVSVAANGITSAMIASGAVVSGEIGNAAVTSGNIASGSIGSVHLASGAVGVAGVSGMLQFNAGGTFGATSGLSYSITSGTAVVTVQPQTAFNVNMVLKASSGQVTNLQQWQNTSGSALAYLDTSGNFYAVSKSFLIDHPSVPGKKLRHVSLEGPTADVFYRGKSNSNTFDLPYYWAKLVDLDNIDVILTPIGRKQDLFVEKIDKLKVHVGGSDTPCYSFIAIAERIDIPKIIVEE